MVLMGVVHGFFDDGGVWVLGRRSVNMGCLFCVCRHWLVVAFAKPTVRNLGIVGTLKPADQGLRFLWFRSFIFQGDRRIVGSWDRFLWSILSNLSFGEGWGILTPIIPSRLLGPSESGKFEVRETWASNMARPRASPTLPRVLHPSYYLRRPRRLLVLFAFFVCTTYLLWDRHNLVLHHEVCSAAPETLKWHTKCMVALFHCVFQSQWRRMPADRESCDLVMHLQRFLACLCKALNWNWMKPGRNRWFTRTPNGKLMFCHHLWLTISASELILFLFAYL